MARRLKALGCLTGKSVDELAVEALDSFAGSVASRSAVVKACRNHGDSC
jgi:hypothetical protein